MVILHNLVSMENWQQIDKLTAELQSPMRQEEPHDQEITKNTFQDQTKIWDQTFQNAFQNG